MGVVVVQPVVVVHDHRGPLGGTLVLAVFLQRKLKPFFVSAVLFSVAFCVVLIPWTIRNYRVFHVFQPLSPAHGEMPGEFVPRGYLLWLRTWLDDSRYIGPVLWAEDTRPIPITAFPASAFDSNEERERVVALLEKYNHALASEEAADEESQSDDSDNNSNDNSDENSNDNSDDNSADDAQPENEEPETQQQPE